MTILLTEELERIQNEYSEESRAIWSGKFAREEKNELVFALPGIPQRVAKAQLKKVVKWGNEGCPHLLDDYGGQDKRECGHCWQALKKEVEL